MKSVVLILPYFGKLPDIFPLFLKTAEKNPDIQFLIITDSSEFFEKYYYSISNIF